MRVALLVMLLVAAPFLAASPAIAEVAPLAWSETPTSEDAMGSYTEPVRHAFHRASALHLQSAEDLSNTPIWLIVSTLPEEVQARLPGSPEGIRAAPLLEHAWLWTYEDPSRALAASRAALDHGAIEHASPQIERQHEPRYVVNDPELGAQWHLVNSGQTSGGVVGEDANVTAAWDSVNGSGVTISIVDDGVSFSNSDLSPTHISSLSWDWCGDDGDPTPSSNDGHGTSAAGVAGARGDDSNGVAGVAYMANLSGQRLIACSSPDWKEAGALSFQNHSNDIYSNSWGPSDDAQRLEAPGPLMVAAFESAVWTGRGGLGNIITWAAGNGLGDGDDSNYDGYANHRTTIAVTAITHAGEQSYYAEPGANILVAAHSNGDGESITTADIPGSGGYNSSGDVTHTFGGTSSATPLVSGVVALMLHANPNLTWRDVQHVLVESARKNDDADSGWGINGAGHDVSHKYGFGAADAHAAVTLARNWTTVGPETNLTSSISSVSTSIPDFGGNSVTDTIQVPQDIVLETVEVILNASHTRRGDLAISLTSPSGTTSILAEQHADTKDDYDSWRFSTVHSWGEDSFGNWTLTISDDRSGTAGTFDDWQLLLHGVDIDRDSDGDGLTDANETTIHGTNPAVADSDSDGLSDGDEVLNESTDPLNPDSDGDGLLDGTEVNINGTDPLDDDSDDDGLSDGAEVNVHQSDPLVADPDADSDLYYWFDDCDDNDSDIHPGALELLNGLDDDCDDLTDEGYSGLDSDQDGLNDYDEFHNHSTNVTNGDTDGDGLGDGEEINVHGTNPLVADPDADGDGWHAFLECDDNDSMINPDAIELLNGEDDDCDEEIDETFHDVDSDGDGLTDYDEYHNRSTDPYGNDTDGDGLLDGDEVVVHGTDPTVHEVDADADGSIWLFDCNDSVPSIHPGANETWNHIDDDCDGDIDDGVVRGPFFERHPNGSTTVHHLTSEPYVLNWSVPNDLPLNATWYRAGQEMPHTSEDGRTYIEPAIDCNAPTDEFQTTLCTHLSRLVTYTVTIEDGNESVSFGWSVRFTVDPPMPDSEPETNDSDGNEDPAEKGDESDDGPTMETLDPPAENGDSEDGSSTTDGLASKAFEGNMSILLFAALPLILGLLWVARFAFEKRYDDPLSPSRQQMIDKQRAHQIPRAPDVPRAPEFGRRRR